jgi:hypothetical protein
VNPAPVQRGLERDDMISVASVYLALSLVVLKGCVESAACGQIVLSEIGYGSDLVLAAWYKI